MFLTLFPDQKPKAGPPWVTVTYRQLLDSFEIASFSPESVAWKLLSDWRELTTNFYESAAVTEGDTLLDKIKDDRGLEGNYLYFKSFVSALNLGTLTLEDRSRCSQRGRRYHHAVFSKDDWHPGKMKQDADGRWRLDPERDLNIHIEPQFNVRGGVLNLYFHYETNPGQTVEWCKQSLNSDEYQAYCERRQRFIDAFKERKPAEVAIGGRSNQIARATPRF